MREDKNAEPREDDHGVVKLDGSVERIIYQNEDNGYTILDLGTNEDEIVTAVGELPFLSRGEEITIWGRWTHNPKYGRQLQVEQYERRMPTDAAAILRYLAGGAIKGIGAKTAQRVVDEFGEDTFDVMENHPEWLANISGISLKKAREIGEDFKQKAGIRSAMLFFREYLGAAMTVRVYKKWGGRAVDLAKQNPYRLCDEIDGIGFERADQMALRLGLDRRSDARVDSGVCYLLASNARGNGHVCLPREKVVEGAAKLLEVSGEEADAAVGRLLQAGRIKYSVFDGVQYLYDSYAYACEKYVAQKLILLDKLCVSVDVRNIRQFIDKEERGGGISYAALQRKAINDALENGVMILTGGPGTGKTTVVRALLAIFDSMGFSCALAAPTGRAAKRLSEATSCEAKTIHRLLEMDYDGGDADTPGGTKFRRDEMNLLEENVIIVDETSMVDNALMCALLKAIKPGARLILIGDADQLPSVGAGNVLRDLIDSGRFATVCLTEIFRQAEKSLIVTNAHAINAGKMPRLDAADNDFFFLYREGDAQIAATVTDLYRNRLPRTYGQDIVNRIQVICPTRRGESGTEHLNRLLQAAMNPPANGKREHHWRDLVFREGDRVMQVRNNYEIAWEKDNGDEGMGIFNGDIGVISEIRPHDEEMEILFEDRRVQYDFTMLEDLEHAWAVTVHKSQGSEYPVVILPLGSAAPMLLTRNLLYTAVTRAQTMAILVGRPDVLQTMVNNHRQVLRYTGLRERLAENATLSESE